MSGVVHRVREVELGRDGSEVSMSSLCGAANVAASNFPTWVSCERCIEIEQSLKSLDGGADGEPCTDTPDETSRP